MKGRTGRLARTARLAGIALAAAAASPAAALRAQVAPTFLVTFGGDTPAPLETSRQRGYAAVPAEVLTTLGGTLRAEELRLHVAFGDAEATFTAGSPFFTWQAEVLQLADAAYRVGEEWFVPVQFVFDVLPGALPETFEVEGETLLWVVAEGGARAPEAAPAANEPDVAAIQPPAPPPEPQPIAPGRAGGRPDGPAFVVVIDPGHGGDDPGALGPAGAREKDVALAMGLALARTLASDADLEVHLTRDRDILIPLWDRGRQATEWKGDRPGVFISLHANALPTQRSVRGFETYFLSEARTEDERRVAANENAPLAIPGDSPGPEDPDLEYILRDLRSEDYQRWSNTLAGLVQQELAVVHPGPDRGVKQGPFAVITNALMPAVLVEVGFITHRQEESLLTDPSFHEASAQAIARAVTAFFERYTGGPGEVR